MNANEDNAPVPDEQASAAPDGTPGADAPVAKPVRKKRTPKAAAEADAGAADVPGDAPVATSGDAAEAVKPARRKRAPAKSAMAADEAVPAETGAAVDAPTEAPAPVVAKPKPRAKVAPVAAPSVVAADDTADDVAVQPVTLGAEADAGDEGQAPVGDAGADGQGERGRRRNRRDRKRGPREEGAEHAPRAASSVGADDDGDDDDDTVAAHGPAVEPADVGEVFAQVLSGVYDEEVAPEAADEGEGAPAAPHKRVLRPEPDAPKLQKVLAQSGVGSRRDMEDAIAEGRVMVNDQVAHTGQRISFGDRIKLDGKQVRVRIVPPPPRIIAYHKPAGEVVTHDDPQHRPTVFRRLPRLQQGKWQSVGRLDLNTEGLLLFTNSGELANQLMHPRFGVEREYAVRVLGTLEADAKAKLLEGVPIEGQTASFRSIEEGGGEGVNRWYRVVITEGRNREVRKLFDAVGLAVSRLIRIRYGTVVLPRGLKRGDWVDLEDGDVRAIRQLAAPPARQPMGDGAERGDRGDRAHNQNAGQGGRGDRDRPQRGARGGQGGQGGDRNNDQQPRQNDGRGPQQGRGPRDDRGNGSGNGPGQGQNKRNGPPQRNNNPRPQDAERSDEPRRQRDDDLDDDFDPSRIPNPLEQTFDKRFVSNPRTPAGGKGFRNGGGGFGGGGSAPDPVPRQKGGGPREPDPLQTSVGYIGGEAFHRKLNRGGGNRQGQGQGGGGGQGGNRGGFGGGGGSGGGNGGKRRGR